MSRSQIQSGLDSEYLRAGKMTSIGGTQYARELRARYAAAGVATPQEQADALHDAAQDVDDRRKRTVDSVKDRYRADPSLRPQYGSGRYKAEVLDALKAAGLHTEEDERAYGPGRAGGLFGLRGLSGLEEVRAVFSGITKGARGGAAAGAAIGSIASGLGAAVGGSLAALNRVGEAVLSGVLSPFGRSGAAVGKAVGALGQALAASLSAAGSVAVSGLSLAGGLAGGLLGGAAAAVPAGVGGLIGLAAGGPGGALLGAGLGATLGGAVVGAVGSILGTVGGAVGQALSAIGSALGGVGAALTETLGSLQGLLSDLIDTGRRYADATLAIGRGGGLGLAASAQYASLGQILTGSPSGLAGLFGNFGTMSPYLASRARAFGVGGVDPSDPASLIGGAYRRYQSYGSGPQGVVRRQILLQGLFPGASDAIGGLFSQGGGAVSAALSAARQTALSPGEALRDARLSLDLSVVQARLDRLKTQFLSDLMPALDKGLSVFADFFQRNQGRIVSGLEGVGRWLYVRLPSLVEVGVGAFVRLGDALLSAVPAATGLAGVLYAGFATVLDLVRGTLIATTALLPGVGPVLSRRLAGIPYLDPGALSGPLAAVNRGAASARQGLDAGGAGAAAWMDRSGLGGGSEADRARQYDHWVRAAGQGGGRVQVQVEITQHDNPDALYRYEARITGKMGQQAVRAVQRAAAG